MRRFRDLLDRFRPRAAQQRDNWPTAEAQTAQGARAASVAALQAEVSRLQQQIVEVSNELALDQSPEARTTALTRMAELEQALERAQRGLGKFQARV